MCILCVIQKCSRKIATMLPWLVIPLIGLWALSQMLPPAFRFEITSPRLACVMVLLVTLFWYEILMPRLSAWRVKRNAMHRERMRFEAIELQKLRKTATRRCRNCLSAYRDQNPGGGKFMCSYCGHISKRPVLDLPVPLEASNSGIFKDLIGKSGRILSSKYLSENGWMCGQDCRENGNWVGGTHFSGNLNNFRKNCGDLYGHDEVHCPTEKSYSRISVFSCKLLNAFLSCIMCLWRKIFRVSSSRGDVLNDADRRGIENRGETAVGTLESRGEKARRKAEEKRLARLEKEQLEEEERKQREEVARLIEERRKLRDEKLYAEKESDKCSSNAKERDARKESDRKRVENKKEKDRGSSKSNSDVEELEKRVGKESDRNKKGECDKKDLKRFLPENPKTHHVEQGKFAAASLQSRGNAGTRYLDRMRGTLLSSSRAFTRGDFFGKSISGSNASREHKPGVFVENSHTSLCRKETIQQDHFARSSHSLDNKSTNGNELTKAQSFIASKQSWICLFPQSSASSSSFANKPTGKHETEAPNPAFTDHDNSFSNSFNHGQSSSESVLPEHSFLPEDSEIFEDACHIPDPISLLGPVSESLDNFQSDKGLEKPYPVKTKPATPELMKPSPIESPLSVNRHCNKLQNKLINSNDVRAWQMWNDAPISEDNGGPISWLFHPSPDKAFGSSVIQPYQNVMFASSAAPPVVDGPWLPQIISEHENQILMKPQDNNLKHGDSVNHHWPKKPPRVEGIGSKSRIGGLYSPPDVESLWSFD